MQRRIRGVETVIQEAAGRLRREPTPAENILWDAVRNRQALGVKFRRQAPIGKFVLDFCAPSCRLVIEVDGDIHEGQKEQDAERTRHLQAFGYHVIRFRNEEILHHLPSVLERIRSTLRSLQDMQKAGQDDS